jgi:DNA-binding IclR family transcriptional regulator
MTLTALAAEVGMSPSKAHFYVTSFVRLGLLTQPVAGGAFTLGPAAVRIGVAALSQIDILQLARDALYEIRDATGQTVFLSVWGSFGPTVVHRVQGRTWSPVEIRVGLVLSALSATGRAFLACYPDSAVESILRTAIGSASQQMPWFKMSLSKARALLDEVRRDGVARGIESEAPGSGFRGLAVPIVDHEGNVQAVLTINGNASELDVSTDGPNVSALLAVARRLSQHDGAQRRTELTLAHSKSRRSTKKA